MCRDCMHMIRHTVRVCRHAVRVCRQLSSCQCYRLSSTSRSCSMAGGSSQEEPALDLLPCTTKQTAGIHIADVHINGSYRIDHVCHSGQGPDHLKDLSHGSDAGACDQDLVQRHVRALSRSTCTVFRHGSGPSSGCSRCPMPGFSAFLRPASLW